MGRRPAARARSTAPRLGLLGRGRATRHGPVSPSCSLPSVPAGHRDVGRLVVVDQLLRGRRPCPCSCGWARSCSAPALAEDLFAGLAPFLAPPAGAAPAHERARLRHLRGRVGLVRRDHRDRRAHEPARAGGARLRTGAWRWARWRARGTLGPAHPALHHPPLSIGAATEQSIARLFMAGVLPGPHCWRACSWPMSGCGRSCRAATRPPIRPRPGARSSLPCAALMPIVLLIAGVIGSIYAGLAAPTEAAAVGVAGALLLSWTSGSLSFASFSGGLAAAARTSAMIALIPRGRVRAHGSPWGYTGLPRDLATWIGTMKLSPVALLAALTAFFVVLGCLLDGISIVVLTVAVILPMVEAGRHRRDLVRHLPRGRGRDEPDHAARRLQPVRHPGVDGARQSSGSPSTRCPSSACWPWRSCCWSPSPRSRCGCRARWRGSGLDRRGPARVHRAFTTPAIDVETCPGVNASSRLRRLVSPPCD